MSEQPVTTKEVGIQLNVPRSTLRRLTRNGKVKGYKLGGQFRYYPADIQAALKEIPTLQPAG